MQMIRRGSRAENLMGYDPYPIKADVEKDMFILERRSDNRQFLFIGETTCAQQAREWAEK